jgi:DNA-directed RNA polymerases I, II, and III subunit RPABC2
VYDDIDDEPAEPYYEEPEDGEDGAGPEDPDTQRRDNNVVVGGDPSAATARKNKNSVLGLKQKRVPNDQRTTTPYMTKYERARVLGTRALQIRYGPADDGCG